VRDAFIKLDPASSCATRHVIVLVEVCDHGAVLRDLPHAKSSEQRLRRAGAIWFVVHVLFATSPRRGRGASKAQADTLRKTRSETLAHVRQPDGT